VLVAAHLGEGNCYEAVRRYHNYVSLLRRELDVEPGAELTALVSPFTGPAAGVPGQREVATQRLIPPPASAGP
jgi:DNA-binding SARP family transcriptional activator